MITREKDYYIDGVKAIKAKLVSRKGSGKERVRWEGSPDFVALATYIVGSVIKDGTTWTVEVTAGQKQERMGLNDYLKL